MSDVRRSRLLTVNDSATYLGVGPKIVRMYVAKGLLKPISLPSQSKTGRNMIRLDRQDLDAFIDNLKRGLLQ